MPVKKDIKPDGWLTVSEYAASKIGYNEKPLSVNAIYMQISNKRRGLKCNLKFDFMVVDKNTFVRDLQARNK